MAKIYAKPIPPIERMQNIQRLVRDPKESPTDMIKAAELMRQSKTPVAYTPRSLSQAATQAQLPRPAPRSVPQPKVPVVVPPPISPEDEEILMAQAGGRASIPQQVQNLSSRGRHGDTMLMHVNPEEFQGLSTLLGPTTTNPDTGLPEAFAWWLPLIGAAIGGVGAAATGRDWKKGLLYGGLLGLGGAGALSLGGASTAAGGLGSTWGPFSGLLGGAGTATGAGVANLGPYTGLVNPAAAGSAGTLTGAGSPAIFNAGQIAQNLSPGGLSLQPSGFLPSSATNIPGSVVQPMGAFQQAAQSVTGGVPPNLNLSPSMSPTSASLNFSPRTMTGSEIVGSGRFSGIKPIYSDRSQAILTGGLDSPTFAGIPLNSASGARPVDPAILKARELKHAIRGAEYGKEYVAKPLASEIPWWKKGLGWAKDHPMAVASGLYGLSSLAGQPQYASVQDKPYETGTIDFTDIKPKKIRKARGLTEEEINKIILEGEDPSSFLEDTDEFAPISFANTGGLLSLARHGRGRDNAAYGGEVAHINANEADMLRRMGGTGSINPVTGLREYMTSGVTGNPAAATAAGAGVTGQGPGTAAAGSAAAAAAQGQGHGPSGNFGFSIGPYGAVATQSPGLFGQGLSVSSNPSSIPGIVANLANTNLGFDPGLVGLSVLGQLGHVAQKGLSTSILGFLAQQGVLGKTMQALTNAPTFARGDVGVTSSSITGEPSAVNTPSVNANTGNVTFGPTVTALPPPALGPAVGQASGGIIRRMTGGAAGERHPAVLSQLRQRIPRRPSRPPAPAPFEFPEVNPFAGGASNFNVQDALSRIAGPNFQQVGSTIPANVPIPPPVLDPATLSAAQGALSGLLNRASQSSFADVGGIQEALQQQPAQVPLEDIIQNQAGGPVQFATGGEFAGHLQGIGDGMSDQIPFHVVPQTPQDIPNAPDMAVLSTDEYVFPADAVSMLGNGSSDAGAKILDNAVKNVRRASIGTPKQIKEIDGQKVLQGALTT